MEARVWRELGQALPKAIPDLIAAFFGEPRATVKRRGTVMRQSKRLHAGKRQWVRALTLAPGQPFIITKRTSTGQKTIWTIERKPAAAQGTSYSAPEPVRVATQIEHALKTAIAAAASAERFATEIGYTVRFSEESIKSLACTVLIQMERAA